MFLKDCTITDWAICFVSNRAGKDERCRDLSRVIVKIIGTIGGIIRVTDGASSSLSRPSA